MIGYLIIEDRLEGGVEIKVLRVFKPSETDGEQTQANIMISSLDDHIKGVDSKVKRLLADMRVMERDNQCLH